VISTVAALSRVTLSFWTRSPSFRPVAATISSRLSPAFRATARFLVEDFFAGGIYDLDGDVQLGVGRVRVREAELEGGIALHPIAHADELGGHGLRIEDHLGKRVERQPRRGDPCIVVAAGVLGRDKLHHPCLAVLEARRDAQVLQGDGELLLPVVVGEGRLGDGGGVVLHPLLPMDQRTFWSAMASQGLVMNL